MNPKIAFWTAALVNLFVVFALVTVGIRSVRRKQISRHRRCMKTSALLVMAFLASYVVKLAVLGRESIASWSGAAVLNLRVHELFVLTMLATGSVALLRARRMRDTRNVSGLPGDPLAPESTIRGHRRAGWTAAICAGLGFATAALLLAGMYRRGGVS
jgi:uncharacterized membrane protein YozB (DUF420 family)